MHKPLLSNSYRTALNFVGLSLAFVHLLMHYTRCSEVDLFKKQQQKPFKEPDQGGKGSLFGKDSGPP